KSSAALENAHRLTAIVLDKTGTITKGQPTVTDVIVNGHLGREDALRLAASAERGSEHPLGQAIVKTAQTQGIALAEPQAFQSVTGRGIEATIDGQKVLVGNYN